MHTCTHMHTHAWLAKSHSLSLQDEEPRSFRSWLTESWASLPPAFQQEPLASATTFTQSLFNSLGQPHFCIPAGHKAEACFPIICQINAWIGVLAAQSCLVIRNRDLEVSGQILASCRGASWKPVGEESTLVTQHHPVVARGRANLGPTVCIQLGVAGQGPSTSSNPNIATRPFRAHLLCVSTVIDLFCHKNKKSCWEKYVVLHIVFLFLCKPNHLFD